MNSPAPEREGFQLTSKTFVVPTDTSRLDPALKRKTTICNLFANHHLPIRDIMRVLDEPYASVVGTLLEFGLVYERRHDRQEPVKIERRQTFFRSLVNETTDAISEATNRPALCWWRASKIHSSLQLHTSKTEASVQSGSAVPLGTPA